MLNISISAHYIIHDAKKYTMYQQIPYNTSQYKQIIGYLNKKYLCNDINKVSIGSMYTFYIIIFVKHEFKNIIYVHEILNSWFYYSFNSKNWFLTGNIIKSIIKLNKVLKNGDFDSLTFSFKNNKSFLYSIK